MSTKVPTPTPGNKPTTPAPMAAKPIPAVPGQPMTAPPVRSTAATQPMTATAPTSSCATVNSPTFCMTPSHQQIAQRAYERWIKRGRPQGTHLQDWFEAEAELKREVSTKSGQKSV